MPEVAFDFTARGQRAFQTLAARVARRGSLVGRFGETLNQHFASLDNKLLTVPFMDSRQYPDGITGQRGADIAGNLAPQSARNLAIRLRYGPLPVNVTATG
jgi:preprotein translocase subunit SecD